MFLLVISTVALFGAILLSALATWWGPKSGKESWLGQGSGIRTTCSQPANPAGRWNCGLLYVCRSHIDPGFNRPVRIA